MSSPSNKLTSEIITFLFELDIFAFRVNTLGVFDSAKNLHRCAPKKGISDILACLPPTGRLLAIEVKIGQDKLSPEQEGFLKNITHVGGLTFVAKDFPSFVSWWEDSCKEGEKEE